MEIFKCCEMERTAEAKVKDGPLLNGSVLCFVFIFSLSLPSREMSWTDGGGQGLAAFVRLHVVKVVLDNLPLFYRIVKGIRFFFKKNILP